MNSTALKLLGPKFYFHHGLLFAILGTREEQCTTELWVHTACDDDETTKTTNMVRKSQISVTAARLVIKFDNYPELF